MVPGRLVYCWPAAKDWDVSPVLAKLSAQYALPKRTLS
jgi:hypothetical protein